MHVSPRELRGIRREGLLTRFAILGPVAVVLVDLPPGGTAGTALEAPVETEAWGFVLRGSLALRTADSRQEFAAGSAFYVPPGPPAHWFEAQARVVVGGFAPLAPDIDLEARLREARDAGWEPVSRPPAPRYPKTMQAAGANATFGKPGTVDVEAAQMGDWFFSQLSFGPMSGYASGWCDLSHWGIVLSGDLAIKYEDSEDSVELLSAGDVYYCPPGPKGHQFQVPDAATTMDYTPTRELLGRGRKSEWRRVAARSLGLVPTGGGRLSHCALP